MSVATGLGPGEVPIRELPRLPLTVFKGANMGGYNSSDHDQPTYFNLLRDLKQKACNLVVVSEHHFLTPTRIEARNSTLLNRVTKTPSFYVARNWDWGLQRHGR